MNLSLPNDREFAWKDGTLWCENVPLKDLAARFGTPLYVYSKQAIVNAFQSYQKPLEPYKHLMCFAVKANSNLSMKLKPRSTPISNASILNLRPN